MNKILVALKRGATTLFQHHRQLTTIQTPPIIQSPVVFSHDPAEGLTADQREVYEMASKFAKTRMRPHMAEWDKHEQFPTDILREAGALGLASIYCSPEYGGTGLSRFDASLVFEALAEGCVSTAAYIRFYDCNVKVIYI